MSNVPLPLEVLDVYQYGPEANRHPTPLIILPYEEWVEVMVNGHAWVRDGEEWHELLPGDIVWQSPGDQTIGRSDFKNPYQVFIVRFRVRRAKGMGVPRFSHWADLEEINLLAKEASRLMWNDLFDRNVLRDYLFAKLIFQVNLHEHVQKMTNSNPITAVMMQIESYFNKPLRMNDLAKAAGWSASHLHAEFVKRMQITPHQMLIQKRLRVAKERLGTTTVPIKSIAAECGFANVPAFAHTFKEHVGQTPTEYRNSHL